MMTILTLDSHLLFAQSFGVEYTTELQTNFKGDNNFVNLLKLNGELPLSKNVRVKVSTLSTAKTNDTSIANDMQVFSNIEVDNMILALSVGGIEWSIDDNNILLFGVHNVNEDFFTSDVTSLFTNSSCGIYPTLSFNYPIANYPVASIGMHYKYDSESMGIVGAVYNGVGYNKFTGRENVFRFCPKSDGIFALAQAEYKYNDSHYFLGGSLHYGELDDVEGHKVRNTLWTYAEQKVADNTTLIGGYSHAFHSSSYCTDFVGLGGKLNIKNAELGLFTDYAHFKDTEEWATELTCKIPINDYLFIQPTAHFISQDGRQQVIGVFRLGIEL